MFRANILCLILMIYKGIGDDDTRFAETEHFPHTFYLLRSFAISLISSVIFGALKAWQLHPEVQSDLSLIIFIFFISIFLSTGILIYGLQYLCFRIAKKRRNKIANILHTITKYIQKTVFPFCIPPAQQLSRIN